VSHRNRTGASALPIPDKSGKRRPFDDFYIPQELWEEAGDTDSFGPIRCISLRHLTPLEEKIAIGRARGESLGFAFELSKLAIAEVSNAIEPSDPDEMGGPEARPAAADGSEPNVHVIADRDGSRDQVWSQLHPKLRQLVMEGYAAMAAPSSTASDSFTKSRRSRA
jgi:hypothetical protein